MIVRRVRRRRSAGFTLVELTIVVAIVGVLAAIATATIRQYSRGSRAPQGIAMIQSIRAAEERYKAENLTYLDVTQTADWYPVLPTAKVERYFYNAGSCGVPLPNTDDCRWKLLNPTLVGPIEFGFKLNAGGPGQAMTTPDALVAPTGWAGWPANDEHWYVIQAVADGDGDGTYARFLASSLRPEIYRENEGE